MNEIARSLQTSLELRQACVIATIVEVDGSAYVREGARCLLYPDGRIVGIVSGGCVEQEISLVAEEVLATGESRVETYDFRAGEDELWGLGVGCNGAITLWLERFDPVRDLAGAQAVVDELAGRETCTEPYDAVSVIEAEGTVPYRCGERWQVAARDDAAELRLVGSSDLSGQSLSDLSGLSGQSLSGGLAGRAGLVRQSRAGGRVTLFVERIEPVPTLVIVGTGEDAVMLCRTAKQYSWRTVLAYHRTARASREVFPDVDELAWVPRADFSGMSLGPNHYVAIMAHHIEIDTAAAGDLLPKPVPYVGILGSRSRIAKMMDSLTARYGELPEEWLAKLHAPIGLDIGGKTPQEITLSIMAELVALHRRGLLAVRERSVQLGERRGVLR